MRLESWCVNEAGNSGLRSSIQDDYRPSAFNMHPQSSSREIEIRLKARNHCIKTIFRYSFTSTASTSATLLRVPPPDPNNDAIEVIFFIEVRKANDLVS